MPDIAPHNTRAHLIGIGEFRFSENSTTIAAALAAGYLDFGNMTAYSLQPKATVKEHKGSYRLGKRIDKTLITDTDLVYQLKFDEIGAKLMRFFLYGDSGTKYSQTIKSAVAADALTSPVKNRWYPLLISGATVRKATAVAITSTPAVVENTDYIIDYETVAIRWLTTPPGTLTSIAITAPAILVTDAASFNRITPHNKPVKRGMARLLTFDRDETLGTPRLAYDHDGFYAELYPEGNPNLATDDYAELTLNCRVGATVGDVWMPED